MERNEQATMKVRTWWFSFFRRRCRCWLTRAATSAAGRRTINASIRKPQCKFIDIFSSCSHNRIRYVLLFKLKQARIQGSITFNIYSCMILTLHQKINVHPFTALAKDMFRVKASDHTHTHEKIRKWNDIKYLFYGLKTHISCHLVFIFYCVSICRYCWLSLILWVLFGVWAMARV